MRISDWSSDVCSSDLAFFRQVLLEPAQVIVLGDAGAEDEEALRPRLGDGEVADDLAGGIQHRREHQAAFSRHAIGQQVRPPALGAGSRHFVLEIGRASRRARGCQYVYIWVDAGSLKKKTQRK